MVTFSVTLTES